MSKIRKVNLVPIEYEDDSKNEVPKRSGNVELEDYQWGGNDTPVEEEEPETEEEPESEEEDSEAEDEEELEENEEEDANEQSEENEEEEEEVGEKAKEQKQSGGGSFSMPKMPGGIPLPTTMLLLLIIANVFTSGQGKTIWGVITFNVKPADARNVFLTIGGELVFLIFISIVAESSDTANKVVTTFIAVLWLVWLYHNRSILNAIAPKSNSIPSKVGGGRPTV